MQPDTDCPVLDGNNYILNGSKIFITNGGQADIYIVFAKTDKTKGTEEFLPYSGKGQTDLA